MRSLRPRISHQRTNGFRESPSGLPTKIWRNASEVRGWCRSTAGAKTIRDAAAIRKKFGVDPPLIPDLLALVGDAADGYPGIAGIGARTAAQLLNRYGPIEKFPSNVLGKQRELALLFKKLATLRTDAPLFKKVETLRWRGPTPAFAAWVEQMKAPRLLERCEKAASDAGALGKQ
jgi:5'-3' exonuclease